MTESYKQSVESGIDIDLKECVVLANAFSQLGANICKRSVMNDGTVIVVQEEMHYEIAEWDASLGKDELRQTDLREASNSHELKTRPRQWFSSACLYEKEHREIFCFSCSGIKNIYQAFSWQKVLICEERKRESSKPKRKG